MRHRLTLALICAASTVVAAEWDEIYWNPVPMDDDVVLPLPCGGAMAFRRVETPVQPNWLADEQVFLGNSDISGQEHSESPVMDGVVGGLTRGGAGERYYLLGKYEVTADQYAAVMSETCPDPDDDGALPADGMPQPEAERFAARYTEWLYTEAPGALTEAAGSDTYLRLPTEAEWEFAARGGLAVTEAARRQTLFAMEGPLEQYVWFAGFNSCDGRMQPVGILDPNPLGLFDVLGNAQEYVIDSYRLRTHDRPHGQVGGATARGGSCLTDEARVRLAERDEVAPIDPETGAPAGKAFTGLRLAVGAPILSGSERITSINTDWRSLGGMRVPIDPGDDPIDVLAAIAEDEADPAIREALLRARETFETEMARRNAIEGRSARSVAQAGLLGVRDYVIALDDIARAEDLIRDGGANDVMLEYRARAEERRQITENVLLGAVVHAAEDFDATTFEAATRIVSEENAARLDGMSERTRQTTGRMLEMFSGFVATYRGTPDTDPQVFLDQIAAYHRELTGR